MAITIPTPTIGQILEAEFLQPLEMTPYRLSRELHVATSTVLDLIHGKRRLTVDRCCACPGCL
jgi:plasmid maintenance system antidote protein VapI